MGDSFNTFLDALPEAGRPVVYFSKNTEGEDACWVGEVIYFTQDELRADYEELYYCKVSVHPFCDKYYVRLHTTEYPADETETLVSGHRYGKFVDGIYDDLYLFELDGVWAYYPSDILSKLDG